MRSCRVGIEVQSGLEISKIERDDITVAIEAEQLWKIVGAIRSNRRSGRKSATGKQGQRCAPIERITGRLNRKADQFECFRKSRAGKIGRQHDVVNIHIVGIRITLLGMLNRNLVGDRLAAIHFVIDPSGKITQRSDFVSAKNDFLNVQVRLDDLNVHVFRFQNHIYALTGGVSRVGGICQ